MAINISIKLDCKKIDKTKLYNSEQTGASYLDATIIMKDEPDHYGNCGMIVQNVSKEEREKGIKGTILGNVRYIQKKAESVATTAPAAIVDHSEELPF